MGFHGLLQVADGKGQIERMLDSQQPKVKRPRRKPGLDKQEYGEIKRTNVPEGTMLWALLGL